MKKLLTTICAGIALICSAAPAAAQEIINFDTLSAGNVVTNQYAGLGVTFSAETGSQVIVTAQNLGSSLPNFICSGVNGSINCVDDIYVDFATAISGLTFLSIGANNVGDVGDVRIFAGLLLLGTADIIANGTPNSPDLIDLTAFSGITRIEISNVTDLVGLGFDDFRFTSSSAVPEPATWAMMLLGFGAMGVAIRRRRRIEHRQITQMA